MTIRHEHQTWINTYISKVKIYARTREMMLTSAKQGGDRSHVLITQLTHESERMLEDLENSLYLKLDETRDAAREGL